MRKSALIIILLTLGIKGLPQVLDYKAIHEDCKSAIRLLKQSKASLPADSLLFQNELQRVKTNYTAIADSLKSNASAAKYAAFETQRLINLCYAATNIEKLKACQAKLFEHVSKYHTSYDNPDSTHNEIAKCIVNSYESQNLWFEDSLLHHVTSALKQHMQSLQSRTWLSSKKQAFVDKYASQYYKRGIISLSEPVFRRFRDVYSQHSETNAKRPPFSKEYPLLSAKLQPTGKFLENIDPERIIIVATNETPFNLIYLITQLRTAHEAYPNTPVCIFRNPSTVSNDYLLALKRNLAFDGYFIIDLNEEDSNNTKNFPCCYFRSENGDMAFATNNPIDFLEWLEKPLSEQKLKQKEQLQANYKKLQAQKDSVAGLPPDNSLKYTLTDKKVSVKFKGYWHPQPDIKIKTYFFTESSYDTITDSLQMAQLEVSIQQNPAYLLSFFLARDTTKISLTADPYHNIQVSFADTRNRQWHKASTSLDSLYYQEQAYGYLLDNYPFQNTAFFGSIKKRNEVVKEQIQENLKFSTPSEKALLLLKHNLNRLSHTEPDTALNYEDLKAYFPIQHFDPVVWKSPYYKQWLDAWINYGINDLKNSIDMLYSSSKIIPDTANLSVSEYLWNKMNNMGRFDIMIHLDTTWLTGCADIKDVDVMKRVEGYKRMAAGKKAPNITWKENGTKMDLYSIEADTTIVVFWSDACPHCVKSLPEMYSKLSPRNNIKVVAVSVDTDESSLNLGEKHMPEWHHVWAKEGWESTLIELFNIFGTPEMYLLNQDHRILGKQINYQ